MHFYKNYESIVLEDCVAHMSVRQTSGNLTNRITALWAQLA